jgi:hypothetical protein
MGEGEIETGEGRQDGRGRDKEVRPENGIQITEI